MNTSTKKVLYASGAALTVGGVLALVFWPRGAKSAEKPAQRAPREKLVFLPEAEGDSFSIAFGDRIVVELPPIPPELQKLRAWAPSFGGDMVVDFSDSPYFLDKAEGKQQFVVTTRGKGNAKVFFTPVVLNAYGQTTGQAGQPLSFFLNVY